MPPLPPVTQALLLVNVAAFFLFQLIGGGARPLMLWPVGSGEFAPWQVISYAFLHRDFGHLLFNMLGLWMFGGALEQVWSGRRYLVYLTACILAAALTQLLVNALLGTRAPTVGASGGVFGVLLGFALLFPNQTVLFQLVLPIKAKYLALIYGALELYQGVFSSGQGVAHFAHLGGMAGGFLVLRYWRGEPPFRRRR